MTEGMRTIQLIVAYDGTELCGYQRQQNGPTVQGYLEEALSKVCNEPITIYGSSRTDAGVHARGQVVAFTTTGKIPVHNLMRALIAHMPPYIVVREAKELPSDWTPHQYVKGKEYIYTIHNDAVVDPLQLRYAYHVRKPLDIEAMVQAGRALEGTHNFSSFKGHNTTVQDPVKTMYAVKVQQQGPTVRIHVIGDGFVYHMVRNMAGFLVDVGLGRFHPEDVPRIIAGENRQLIGKTAPAHGLCLDTVFLDTDSLDAAVARFSHV